MRSLAAFVLTVFSFSVTDPASAQIAGRYDRGDVPPRDPFLGDGRMPGPSIGQEIGDIVQQIDRARDSGAITRREARRLTRETRQIDDLARRYARDGLSATEGAELEARARDIRNAIGRARLGR